MTRPVFGRLPKDHVRALVVVNFDKYNPPAKALNKEVREGGALKWVRWEIGAHRDADILDMPPGQRFVWQTLVELAGSRRIGLDGTRIVRLTVSQLARESHTPEADVEAALEHLRKRRRIRYSKGGEKVANRHRVTTQLPEPGGERVATYQRTNVPTDLPTNVPTGDAVDKSGDEGTAWVRDAQLRALLDARRARLARVDA